MAYTPFLTKKCRRCGEAGPRKEFFVIGKGGKLWFTPICELCRLSPQVESEEEKRLRLKVSRYKGLTVEKYQQMRRDTNNRCEMCGKPLTDENINIDHDHKTNKVRGLLCFRCNSGIGFFFDDPAYLQKAINYLESKA